MTGRRSPTSHLYAVVLAGGRGTRFWPRSRQRHPKQLMNFWGRASLLQQTVERLRPLIQPANVWVLTNEYLAEEVARQLPEVPRAQIIAEPVQRNTAPCIGLAAELIGMQDAEAVLGVFPSDQTIRKPATFRQVVRLAAKHAAQGAIVVLGITPRWPETGYGYVEFARAPNAHHLQALPVKQFREKPSLAVAERYVRSRRFFWNSGMFFWKASTIREALRRHLPQTAAVLQAIPRKLADGSKADPGRMRQLLRRSYPSCENISVDYAVLEKASEVVGVPCDIGWNDVGSWNAVYDLLPHDRMGNVLRTAALLTDSSGLLVDVPGKLVAGIGLKDLAVVETDDALLIVPRNRSQEVSQLVKQLETERRKNLL
ncbi:MAG: mannose-1-phosphate guanylyltransferase [Acidobacteria bacterium]|nr:mannose-1-phosphate guanylyltransferase [Acidobacteriota bacterium]